MMLASGLVSLTERATVLSPDHGHVLSFDREGRMLYCFRQGKTFKRSLSSEVHLRFRQGKRQRRCLTESATLNLFSEVYESARSQLPLVESEARKRLGEEVLRWTPDTLLAEKTKFEAAYKPVSILPPDQYRAIVLQATEGCSWNRCTFCNFYMNRPFAVRTEAQFVDHIAAVKALLGKGERLRRGLFLADGNALSLSNRRLEPLLDRAVEAFPGHDLYGFVDLFSGERRSLAEWQSLKQWGLQRVYVGMETGLDELLRWVNKPGSAEELEHFVARLKAARLKVGLIVMVGLGGVEYRKRHRDASRQLLQRLPLDRHDLIYLSPFVELGQSAYARQRQHRGLRPMSEIEVDTELEALASELRDSGLRTSRYDIREFVY
jgi:radical SAM superfamily enzyme YgiQ (UPF0313 family)